MKDILTPATCIDPASVAHYGHNRALLYAGREHGRPDFAHALGAMLRGWQEYAECYPREHGSKVGDDNFIGPAWQAIGKALRTLLNGSVGGFDCGSLDSNIIDCATENGVDTEGW